MEERTKKIPQNQVQDVEPTIVSEYGTKAGQVEAKENSLGAHATKSLCLHCRPNNFDHEDLPEEMLHLQIPENKSVKEEDKEKDVESTFSGHENESGQSDKRGNSSITIASMSSIHCGPENSNHEEIPKVMSDMKTRDKEPVNQEENAEHGEPTTVNHEDNDSGHGSGRNNGQPKQAVSYMVECIVGTGSFGVVYKAKCIETCESVAIKKVLQDKRYKHRELQIMRLLNHHNVIQMKHCFYSTDEMNEIYLNLVLEYVPETLYQASKKYTGVNEHPPIIYVQIYAYQIFRALNYLHRVIGVCHRDIKPQNMLVNPDTLQLKICDFGSAKLLVPGEPNITYIGTRYYKAPELMFGATKYTFAIDMWSAGCVMAELLLGQPLFVGDSSVNQLVEIIKVLGTPTREDIKCMNPNYREFKVPLIKAHPWHKIFHGRVPTGAMDLVSRLLQYSPTLRCTALEACGHPFFNDLREPNVCLPNGRQLPPLFDFTPEELAGVPPELLQRLIPDHLRR